MGSMQLTGAKSQLPLSLSVPLSLSLCASLSVPLSLFLSASLSASLSLCLSLSLTHACKHTDTQTHKHAYTTANGMVYRKAANKMAEYKISKELSYKPRVLHFLTLIHICCPLFHHLIKFCVQFNMPSSKESIYICIESVYINSRSLFVMKFQPLIPSCHVTTWLYIWCLSLANVQDFEIDCRSFPSTVHSAVSCVLCLTHCQVVHV